MSQGRLSHAGDVLDQQMPAGKQARDGQPDLELLAEYDPFDLRDDL
jgi:hypothetical protein